MWGSFLFYKNNLFFNFDFNVSKKPKKLKAGLIELAPELGPEKGNVNVTGDPEKVLCYSSSLFLFPPSILFIYCNQNFTAAPGY